jgi:hypothetical protein
LRDTDDIDLVRFIKLFLWPYIDLHRRFFRRNNPESIRHYLSSNIKGPNELQTKVFNETLVFLLLFDFKNSHKSLHYKLSQKSMLYFQILLTHIYSFISEKQIIFNCLLERLLFNLICCYGKKEKRKKEISIQKN